MSKSGTSVNRLRRYTEDDLARHRSKASAWVSYKRKIADVTSFMEDHPGGPELLLRYAGKDVEAIMGDPTEYAHGESAYEILADLIIGTVHKDYECSARTILSDGGPVDHEYHPDDTDLVADYQKTQFLDLSQPLFIQMWQGDFSKDFYLKQVHQPRHLKGDAILFGPWYLEMFTKTSWYVIPALWLPIAGYLFKRCMDTVPTTPQTWIASSDPGLFAFSFWALGIVIWTILEYIMHRFIFHVDAVLPDRRELLCLHFLIHGIHHYLPMDRLRLVMPPLLFYVLQWPFTKLAFSIFPLAIAQGIISGAFTMYVGYDCCHYALHHTKFSFAHLREQKAYHLAHHYKNYELGYGITSRFWDTIFGTELVMR